MCACGGNANIQTLNTQEVNALLAAAQQQAVTEQEAMLASAQKAVANAGGGSPQPQPAQ